MTSTRSNPSGRDSTANRTKTSTRGAGRTGASSRAAPRPWFRRPPVWVALAVVAALGTLFVIFTNAGGGNSTASGRGPSFVVGSPGPGQPAPDFSLASASGGTVSLGDYRGRNVLLYFQEGLMCQPCWTQITDLEKAGDAVKAAGVDDIVSITTDRVDLLGQKVRDEGITGTPVLSDPNLAVSQAYGTNGHGMMGGERNGHSFILVGPDGKIRWRADYGGAPDYTMYVPTDQLLADLRDGTAAR